MINETLHNAKVYRALVAKELYVLKSKLFDAFINGTILLVMQVMIFGYLFPLMGMSAAYSAPLFIGTVMQLNNNLFYNFGMSLVFDLNRQRFIDYHLSLPISKQWLFASYITNYVIEGLITTLPLMCFGIVLLGDRFSITETNWFLFAIMYLLMLIFFSTAYLLAAFTMAFERFMDDFWPLIGSPLMCSGCVFFTWKKLYAFSPTMASIILINPITYIAEGLRGSLLGTADYISPWVCAAVLLVLIVGMFYALSRSLNNRLDPV